MNLDLNDFNSVAVFAKSFREKYDKLDILMNNAGVMAPLERLVTTQGYERQFGVNHLAHFLLTNLLMDLLKKTP